MKLKDRSFNQILNDSVKRLEDWLIKNDWKAYDPFEGLNSWLRPLTFEVPILRQVLVQSVKRCPLNIRPLIGIKPTKSSKGIAYIVKGDLKFYKVTKDEKYKYRATEFLNWLKEISCKGYNSFCWGNHFDYQTRGYYLKKNNPTLVWTSLTGRAFADAFFILNKREYREIVESACNFIIEDLPKWEDYNNLCISYVTHKVNLVHNANLLGASLLSLGFKITGNTKYKETAEKAVRYSVEKQLENGAWYYGEEEKYHWIDNWHTGYNLDSIKIYQDCTQDFQFNNALEKGLEYYNRIFFTEEGIPKFYYNNVFPIDIQSCSQSIDTLILTQELNPSNIELAKKVALWTINNMQDVSGYFYFMKKPGYKIKIPMFHWGQATMYHSLSNLISNIKDRD